jgi:hypothetical protein
LWFVTGVTVVGSVIRSKTFQHWVTYKVAQYFSDELKTQVSIAGFRVDNFTFLHLDSIYIADRMGDTAFYVNEFTVDLDRLNWNFDDKEKRINLQFAEVDGAVINFRQYHDTGDWNYEFVFDYFDPPKDSTDTIPGRPFLLKVKQLDLINSTFAYRNPTYDSSWAAKFHPDDFRFTHINGVLDKFSLVDDSLSFITADMTAREKNGFYVKTMAADARIYAQGLEFYNMHIETEKSSLGEELKMNYAEWDELSDFIEKVTLNAHITKSVVSMEDVAYWGPNMENMKQVVTLNGLVRGTVDNLKGREITVEAGSETMLKGQFDMKGLPDFYATYIDMKFDKAHTIEADVKQLFDVENLPAGIKTLGRVDFTGKFTGFPNSFVAYGNFNTGLGKLSSDIKLDFSQGVAKATYSGVLKTDGFDLGTFVNETPTIKQISFDANVQGTGMTLETVDLEIKGNVNSIQLNNYALQNIEIDGNYAGKFFEGFAKIRDENLNLDFNGGVDFTSSTPKMNFVSTIYKADLYKLGIDTVSSSIQGKVYLDFAGDKLDNIDGTMSVGDVLFKREGRTLQLDTASLIAAYSAGLRRLILNSNIVDAEIAGQYNFSALPSALYGYAATLLPQIVKSDTTIEANENFKFKVNFKKPTLLSLFLWDDVLIDPFEAIGSINTATNDVQLNLRAPLLRFADMEFKHIGISTPPSENGTKKLELKCGTFIKNDSAYFEKAVATLIFDNNRVLFDIEIPKTIARLNASLKGRLLFTDSLYSLIFNGSSITSKPQTWTISNDALVSYLPQSNRLLIDGLNLSNINESIRLNGTIGKDIADTLRVDFETFKISNVNYFTRPPTGQELGGTLNGHVVLFNLFDVPLFSSSLSADSLSFGKDTLGDIFLASEINNVFKIITVKGGFENGRLQGSKINGFVSFDKKARRNLNLSFRLNNATPRFLEPFLTDIASEFEGTFSAELNLRGTFDNPELSGEASLGNVGFKIDYLQTRYFVDTATITVSQNRFSITPFKLKDEKGSVANASGYVSHKDFSNFYVNFSVRDMNSFMALNTKAEDNDLYYGTAFMTGSYYLSGPFDDLYMEVKGKSEKGTSFNLKLLDENSVNSYDFITFVDYTNKASGDKEIDLQGIRLNLFLDVTPDADIKIFFDSQFGDVIEGRGYANLRMEINTLGDFRMFGTFEIEKGLYKFTALDLVKKPFVLAKGGSITWTGDPLNANINIKAVYTHLASVQPLLLGLVSNADLSNYSTPVQVEAIMELKGALLKPDIRFGLNIPNLNTLRGNNANTSVLLNALRRIERDQEEMSRQVFSFLSLNQLATPTDNGYDPSTSAASSGSNAGLDALSNSVGNLLSSQLTNWLSKYDPKWNIGVQVGQGGYANRNDVIISASRKWLNDRLQVDVSIDPNTTQGNFSANYKINPNGNYQARAFSRNTNNPVYNQNILSFGGGFYLRSEFENFAELRRKLLLIRKKEVAVADTIAPEQNDTLSALPSYIKFH